MALRLALCAVVPFYGPSSCSMCHCSVLWPFVLFYVPSFRSMDLHPAMCHCSVLWPFVSLYVPSFRSMALRLVLCAIIPFYGPLSFSMCHRSVLWTLILLYLPSSCSIARHLNQCNFYTQLWMFIHPNA